MTDLPDLVVTAHPIAAPSTTMLSPGFRVTCCEPPGSGCCDIAVALSPAKAQAAAPNSVRRLMTPPSRLRVALSGID
jgi:hypothetical protein